jgi:hypothetical protein
MQLIDLKKAFGKPFQEKNAPAKVGFYFGITILFYVLYFGFFLFTGLIDSSNSRAATGAAGALSILGCCIFLVFSLVIGAIGLWYQYEYMQAAFEDRETTVIWQEDLGTVLKKAIKLFLVSFVYYLPIIVVAICLYFAVIAGFIGSIGGLGYLSQGSRYGDNSDALAGVLAASGGLILVICCAVLVFVIGTFLYSNFIVNPAILRMVSTNTFGRAFDLSANWKLMSKNFGDFAMLALVQVGLGLVWYVLYFIASFLTIIIVGYCLLIPLVLLSVYYQSFAHPVLMGNFYRVLKHTKKA